MTRVWPRLRRLLAACVCLLAIGGAAQAAERISLQFSDVEVRDCLTALAQVAGADLVVDDSVSGKITVRFEAADFPAALDLIARTKGLKYRTESGVTVVTSRQAMREYFGAAREFALRFADPAEAAQAVRLALGLRADKEADGAGAPLLTRQHSLLFYGTPREIELVRALLERIDAPLPQVKLEAKVVALQKDAAKALGIDWEWSKLPQSPDREVEYRTVTRTVTDESGKKQTISEEVPRENSKRHWKNAGEGVPGVIRFGHGPDGLPFEAYYAATLSALVADGKADLLARPSIMALGGKEAVINIGSEVPVPVVSITNATTTTSMEYRQAGIILKYTPRIHGDGYITAEVHTEVSSPSYVADLKAYRFNKRAADTLVRLRDGETMVIGGLIGSEESKALRKIPFLGDLPVLGALFRSETRAKSESEVMIFLTATIVKERGCATNGD